MAIFWTRRTLALGYVRYAPVFLFLLVLSSKAAGSSCCGEASTNVTPDSVIWIRIYLAKEVIGSIAWSACYSWAVYQPDVGGRVFADGIFYFLAYLMLEVYSIYIIWSF
eukprot:SAG31_NODE_25367_length_462_cov_1.413223_1_plen_108_part_01